jgi:Trp operon repressor
MSTVYKIEEEITLGELSFRQIAEKYNVSIADVELIFDEFMKTMAEAY